MNENMPENRGAFARLDESGEAAMPLTDMGSNKLNVTNWLEDVPGAEKSCAAVEVRFKNTRKGYYNNVNNLPLKKGDVVTVEASPGHDVGVVSLTGPLVRLQMKKYNVTEPEAELRKIYRKAKAADIEKWYQAVALEPQTMLRARQLAATLQLNMKISDVEFQGDKTKAIFYYISDDRVDFRELIKLFADEFKIRIEMKQIGARQEAGRVGGIGSCGRALCCASWMSNFVSVSTSAARYQDISLNPQKLAGQCGKLKCCLNYELKSYMEAQKEYPSPSVVLETEAGPAFHRKTDVFRRLMWYAYRKDADSADYIPLDVDAVKEIIAQNKKGIKVPALVSSLPEEQQELGYQNAVGEESISRFEEKRKKKKKKKRAGAAPAAAGTLNENQPESEQLVTGTAEDAPQPSERSQNRPARPRQGKRNGNQPRPEQTPDATSSAKPAASAPRPQGERRKGDNRQGNRPPRPKPHTSDDGPARAGSRPQGGAQPVQNEQA